MNSASEVPFPTFEHPPVTEVVLAVGFEPLESVSATELMRFAINVEDEFPDAETKPPYSMPLELFGSPRPQTLQVEVIEGVPPVRLWLRDAPRSKLIQVQADWFAANWQNEGGSAPYPRYSRVEELFRSSFDRFTSFLSDRDLGRVAPTQCEVTYINHIRPSELWSTHGRINHVLRLAGVAGGAILGEPDSVDLQYSYVVPDASGLPRGRLRIRAQSAFSTVDDSPVIAVNLTVRALPLRDDADGIMECLQTGREWIVKGFVDITTAEAHKEWGLHE